MMTKGRGLCGLVLAALYCFSGMSVTFAQQEDDEFLPGAETPAELEAVDAIVAETNPADKLTLSAAFLIEYPDSELVHQIHEMRLDTYNSLGIPRAVIEAAESALATGTAYYESKMAEFENPSEEPGFAAFQHIRMNNRTFQYQSLMQAHWQLGEVEETVEYGELAHASEEEDWESYGPTLSGDESREAAESHRQKQLSFLQTIMTAHQDLNDAAKIVEFGERALELAPDDLVTLMTVSNTMSERLPQETDAVRDHLERAEEYAKGAIGNLERLLDGPVGAQMGAERRADLLAGVHSTLGLVYLNQGEFGDAQDEYETALETAPNDSVAYFRLGMAYVGDDDVDEALEALARSVYLKGVTEVQAREMLEQVYEIKNGSLDGLDEFIQMEGERIGN